MTDKPKTPPVAATKSIPLEQRIAELRSRDPVYLNHGEALLLQGLAAASFREQRLTEDRLALEG